MMLKKNLISAALMAVLAVLASPVVYGQGTPDGETPANERVCDELMGLTPALYGLCVAFCEAQDCEASFDPATNEVTFDPSCKPSNPKLLENYNKRANPGDPAMPCVNIVESGCPCWTEAELFEIGDEGTFVCEDLRPGLFLAFLSGSSVGFEFEEVTAGTVFPGEGPVCIYQARQPEIVRFLPLTGEEATICVDSIAAECVARGF